MLHMHAAAAKCIVERWQAFQPAPCLRCGWRSVSITLLMQKWLSQLLSFCFASLAFGATSGSSVRDTHPVAVESQTEARPGELERAGMKKPERIYVIPVRE